MRRTHAVRSPASAAQRRQRLSERIRLLTRAVSPPADRNSSQLENESVRWNWTFCVTSPKCPPTTRTPPGASRLAERRHRAFPAVVVDDVEHDPDRVHDLELSVQREARITDVRLHDRHAGNVGVPLFERADGRLRDLDPDRLFRAEDLEVEVDPVPGARAHVQHARRVREIASGQALDDRVLDGVVVEAAGERAPFGRDRVRVRERFRRGAVPGLEEALRVIGNLVPAHPFRVDVVLDELRAEHSAGGPS